MLHEVCGSLLCQEDNTPFISEGVVGLNTVKIERDAVGTTSLCKIAKKEKGSTCSFLLHILVKLVSSNANR